MMFFVSQAGMWLVALQRLMSLRCLLLALYDNVQVSKGKVSVLAAFI